jgi:hypothetical protein
MTFLRRLTPGLLLMPAILMILLSGTGSRAQLIRDPQTLSGMSAMFQKQQKLAEGRQKELFGVFDNRLQPDEQQALEYLYAYMPLSDLADYSGDFYLQQVKAALKAHNEMPWGKTIPEDVFLHFVLPPRVNNENLDAFRMVMYDEISHRIAGMSMHDAALEINHWCHEKVTYRGSDERTSAPLATLKTSFGRCGEESTFTVTALRTAGIPARQVYTPRWAHTDDNHAWVEVWIDGTWYFMGACEPDPELNMGWFSEPARRAMLVHTRAFGAYTGSEPVIDRQERFAELNLISNYASTRFITVKVTDAVGRPVPAASVEYQLYNYAEFYPIAKATADERGMSSITTGLGDLLIWAYSGDQWGYSRISADKTDSVTVVISGNHVPGLTETFDLQPPVAKNPLPAKVSEAVAARNAVRLQEEDSIRMQYMNTFRDSVWVSTFATEHGLDAKRLLPLFRKSYGNWQEIADFLTGTPDYRKEWALYLLEAISEKDLRDATAIILRDHLDQAFSFNNATSSTDPAFFAMYVMSGRIANEMMLPWRSFLQKQFPYDFIMQFKTDIGVLTDWIKTNIRIDNTANMHSRAPLSPRGVYELRVADSRSRDIFFVAVCRSLGHAARINPATGIPQYHDGNAWQNVVFEPVKENIMERGFLHFVNESGSFDPKYAVNFTVARFSKGVYRTVDFDYGLRIGDFADSISIEAGKYMLVTGNRQSDGSVLSSVSFFDVPVSGLVSVSVKIRQDFSPLQSWGKLDPARYTFRSFGKGETVPLKTGKSPGTLMVWIDPDKEPSKHVLADIPAVSELIETWGGQLIFLFATAKVSASFHPQSFPGLPKGSVFAYDPNAALLKEISRLKQRGASDNLPVVVIMDAQGNLVFYTEGYQIGIGEQIAKTIAKMR